MNPLRKALDNLEPLFHKGGKLETFYPAYEALDTFLFTPGQVTSGASHVRDGMDLKRMMSLVIVALIPCIYMAMWNTGRQANFALLEQAQRGVFAVDPSGAPGEVTPEQQAILDQGELIPREEALALAHQAGWRGSILDATTGLDPNNWIANIWHGALFFLPIYIVTMVVGGTCEAIFSVVRKHEINEGFLVTGMLFPLTLPPAIPLWQVGLGIAFGVVVGKEVFGGTGKNFLNPALTARAFLYFAYATEMSGEIWNAAWNVPALRADGYTAATSLNTINVQGSSLADIPMGWSGWWDAFLGTTNGSMGETSALACLIGAAILIGVGVGSWRIMLACVIGLVGTSMLLWAVGTYGMKPEDAPPMWLLPPYFHLVLGGFAFGAVFMATDPVSASMTRTGMWWYGILIGVMTMIVRAINGAFAEGIMLAILFGNTFAPLIDYFVIQGNIKRRLARNAA